MGVGVGFWLGLASGDPDGVTVGLVVALTGQLAAAQEDRWEEGPAWADVVPGRVGPACVRLAVGDCPWPPPAEWAPA